MSGVHSKAIIVVEPTQSLKLIETDRLRQGPLYRCEYHEYVWKLGRFAPTAYEYHRSATIDPYGGAPWMGTPTHAAARDMWIAHMASQGRDPQGMPTPTTLRSASNSITKPSWGGYVWNAIVALSLLYLAWCVLRMPFDLWIRLRTNTRRARGLCRHCGYDLRGLPFASHCPECGSARAADEHRVEA